MFDAIFVHPLFNLLAILYAYVHDFGLAVIILTIIIRLLIWPLVTRQLHSQRALQELQPELRRIKAEAAGDRQLEGKMTLELYKEREINPYASFLPLLIQLPIFFALFIVLRDIVKPGEIAQIAYEPVKQLGPIAEIIKNNAAFHPTLFNAIDLTKASPLLAALAAVAQFIQTKQIMPKHQPDDVQAKVMAGMVYLFPVLTLFIGLTLPSALPLYWLTASLVAILQQYLVLKRDVEELEEGTPTPRKATAKQKPKPKPQLTTSTSQTATQTTKAKKKRKKS